jgi:hypothetical protein|tara:strand:+ start:37 stop:366 length:330 start_codon:yes stop_codon:yes gene_type:complete
MREVSPVITLAGLREALEAGGTVEVECMNVPERQSNQYRAAWKFYVLAEVEGQTHRLLLVHGRDIKAKTIRTLTGLYSFGMDLGVSPISVPRHAGERAVWKAYEDTQKD